MSGGNEQGDIAMHLLRQIIENTDTVPIHQ